MADVICRWRNATPETVVELANALPHYEMDSQSFREIMGSSIYGGEFFRTPYQLACQLGLYYEDSATYYPRFDHNINKEEATVYLQRWIHRYYAPNPYTKSLGTLESPILLVKSIVEKLEEKDGQDLKEVLEILFKDSMGNVDIVRNLLNSFSNVVSINNDGKVSLKENYKDYMEMYIDKNDKKAFFHAFDDKREKSKVSDETIICDSKYRPFITAIKTKPFLLLAGISGTGKSRIVRELARACWDTDSPEYKSQKPRNFEMVQVKPNWHDSSELIGYVSRVSGKAEFVAGDFLRFVARAWAEPDVPYFLCLDEMNLAPVEQYFAEYLSVLESRKAEDGVITTDPIFKKVEKLEETDDSWYEDLVKELTKGINTRNQVAGYDADKADLKVRGQFMEEGIAIPQNLIVIGTVNMDETTYSFSRKVLDRAMTIEMNEVDFYGGLDSKYEAIGKLSGAELIGTDVEGVDIYEDNKDICDKVLEYLVSVNKLLEGTPFAVGYRTRNEFLLYVLNNLPYNKDKDGNELSNGYVIARALDEITSMKILSRIEGDETKVDEKLISDLQAKIEGGLNGISGEENIIESKSIAKLKEMRTRLEKSGYTSFWG